MGLHLTKDRRKKILERLPAMIATGQNKNQIAQELGVSHSTISRYIHTLESGKPQRKTYTRIKKPQLIEMPVASESTKELKLKVVHELLRFMNEK